MKVTNTSILTNTESSMDLPLTATQLAQGHTLWEGGTLLQDAFPMLNASEREFIKTGITPQQWEDYFGGDE